MLADWLRLFSDRGFRRELLARVSDPLVLAGWQQYEAMTPAQQQEQISAPLDRVMSLLSRPAVRGVLSQPNPRLDLRRLLDSGGWLIAPISPTRLGEPAARLITAVLVQQVMTAIQSRAALPAHERRPLFFYADELAALAEGLPFGLETFLEQSRGLGCGVTVATQTLGRLPQTLAASLLGNVGSLVSFRLGYEEARRVSHELPGLGPEDLQALGRFEVAARVSGGRGSTVSVVTGQTEPLPPVQGLENQIRRRSTARYGRDPEEVDAELRERLLQSTVSEETPVGRRRRRT